MKLPAFLLTPFVASTLVHAVPEGAAGAAAPADSVTQICVIPLGVVPELVPELKNGVMGFAQEREGTRPPAPAQWWLHNKEGGYLAMSLNAPAEIITVKGKEAVGIRIAGPPDSQGKPSWKPWIEIPVAAPGKPQSVFLTKSSPKEDWLAAPKQWPFDDSPEAFPPGCIRVVNLSSITEFVVIGEQKLQIPPGRQTIVHPPADVVSIHVGVQGGAQVVPTLNTARKVEGPERIVLATFDWDTGSRPGDLVTPAKSAILYMPSPLPAADATTDAQHPVVH